MKDLWSRFLHWHGWKKFGAACKNGGNAVCHWGGWKKLFGLPAVLLLVLTIVCAGGLIWLFLTERELSVPAYFLYALAFYTLTADCVLGCTKLPQTLLRIRERIDNSTWGKRCITDPEQKRKNGFYADVCITLLYVLLQMIHWYQNRSWWFVVLAVYYTILLVMRYLLARFVHNNGIGSNILAEWKRTRTCACILLLVNLSLSGAVLMILYQSKGYNYPGIMIYVMALYTFYSTIHAIVDIVKYQKLGSPIMSTAKIVSLCAALVSMLNLETAMFAQFGADMERKHQQLMIALTGAGVSIVVVTLSVLLIVKATKEIRREKNGK